MRRSGITAERTYEISCAQTQIDWNISDQPKISQQHLQSVHASELGLSLSKPAFLKATTTQKMLLPLLQYVYVYLLCLLSVWCICVDASVYYLQVWDKKKDSKMQLSLSRFCKSYHNSVYYLQVGIQKKHSKDAPVQLLYISFVEFYMHDLLVNV